MQKDFLKKGIIIGVIIPFVGAGVVPNVISSYLTFPTIFTGGGGLFKLRCQKR